MGAGRAIGPFLVVLSLVLGSLPGLPGEPVTAAPNRRAADWELVFADEFDGTSLDLTRWETQFPWGRDRSNVGELQYYDPNAFAVRNGSLRIKAREARAGRFAYRSGLIASHRTFAQEYGRFEIRARLPRGKGLWPAFWLLPTDTSWPPEIDVFEALGDDPTTVFMTAHWLAGDQQRQEQGEFSGPDFAAGFHTFAVEWGPNEIIWSIDGVVRHQAQGLPITGPMYVLANLAVGGEWPGEPDETTVFPASFDIDYIRVYRAAGDGGDGAGRRRGDDGRSTPGDDAGARSARNVDRPARDDGRRRR